MLKLVALVLIAFILVNLNMGGVNSANGANDMSAASGFALTMTAGADLDLLFRDSIASAKAASASTINAKNAENAAFIKMVKAAGKAMLGATMAIETSVTPVRNDKPFPETVNGQPVVKTIGYSVKKRPISITSFGQAKTKVLVVGGVHGNEYGTAVARDLIKYLKVHTETIPKNQQIDIIDCLNPDGFVVRSRANANGVDLNRNMPSKDWAAKLSRGDVSAKLGYTGGKSAGSEPETKAFLSALKNRYKYVLTLHSKAGIVEFSGPGGKTLATKISKQTGLPVKHISYGKSIHGSAGRYIPEAYKIPVITLELNNAKLTDKLRNALTKIYDF